jgi:hypothetical protein
VDRMKNGLAILSLVVAVAVSSIATLGANSSGTSSASGRIGSLYDIVATTNLCESCRLVVCVIPSSLAQANRAYVVNLYEKGKLRDSNNISWSQPQIDMQEYGTVCFQLSEQEVDAYESAPADELREVFSIRVQQD